MEYCNPTYAKNDISNILHLNSIYTFQELNPEYEYIFFNNQECRQFIKENFEKETLYYYDILFPGAFKASEPAPPNVIVPSDALGEVFKPP